MITTKTKLKNVIVIQPPTVFEDYRGIYLETFNEKLYADIGIPIKFIQDKNIISGFVVKLGSTMIDFSMKSKLDKIINALK